MMYDELVKRLKDDEAWKNCDFDFIYDWMHEAADAIEELQKAVNFHKFNSEFWEDKYNSLADEKWIPVTERLPEEYVNVLCHLRSLDRKSEYYSIDHLMEDGQWWKAANSWKHEVTHWMPLPEPPKEET